MRAASQQFFNLSKNYGLFDRHLSKLPYCRVRICFIRCITCRIQQPHRPKQPGRLLRHIPVEQAVAAFLCQRVGHVDPQRVRARPQQDGHIKAVRRHDPRTGAPAVEPDLRRLIGAAKLQENVLFRKRLEPERPLITERAGKARQQAGAVRASEPVEHRER